jgi:predicted ATPase
MKYISTFKLSNRKVKNPNLYPYNIFSSRDIDCFLFNNITIFYGSNASGKSTMLNILAQKLEIKGAEDVNFNPYFYDYISECSFGLGENDQGKTIYKIPSDSRYIKSEDILYEIKKIQQSSVLEESIIHEKKLNGLSKKERLEYADSYEFRKLLKNITFGQEKYSNGETSLKIFDEMIDADSLYLLDEPEISLTPQNQVILAEKINLHARLLGCQFIIATHSPFMLGTLNGTIYNMDDQECSIVDWKDTANVKFYYEFFKKNFEG